MADGDVTKSDFDQMWSELRQLAEAWRDRHYISARGISGMLVQHGATIAHAAGIPLEEVLDLVRMQWKLLKEKEGRQ